MLKDLVIFSIVFLSHSAWSEDFGFRYDERSFRCQNEIGIRGYNPNYVGECGHHRDAHLVGSYWENHKVAGSDFSRANLNEATFYQADMRGSILKWAEIKNVNFEHANLVRADLRRAHAKQAIFYWTNLQNAKLQGADFSYADFRGATLDLALVDEKTHFNGAVFDEFTSLPFSHAKAKSLGMKFIPSRSGD